MFGIESVLITGLFKLTLALIGIIVGRTTLYWFDHYLADSKFNKWLENANDESKANYYAGRFIAIAIIIGCAIG